MKKFNELFQESFPTLPTGMFTPESYKKVIERFNAYKKPW